MQRSGFAGRLAATLAERRDDWSGENDPHYRRELRARSRIGRVLLCGRMEDSASCA